MLEVWGEGCGWRAQVFSVRSDIPLPAGATVGHPLSIHRVLAVMNKAAAPGIFF